MKLVASCITKDVFVSPEEKLSNEMWEKRKKRNIISPKKKKKNHHKLSSLIPEDLAESYFFL